MYEMVKEAVDKRDFKTVKETFEHLEEADIADLMQGFHDNREVDAKDISLLFRLLPKDTAAEVFTYMETDMKELLINRFTDTELEDIVDNLFIDDTVDLIEEMPANVVQRILAASDPQSRKMINMILKYPEDSAGSIMTTEFVYMKRDQTVKECLEKIRSLGMVKETVYTIYVTEQDRRLVGVLSILDLLTADDDDIIGDIMDENVITALTTDDQEQVAAQFAKYDFVALPIVDNENRIVGIVTFDDAMDVVEEEATEDMAHMAATMTSEESYFKTSVIAHARNRIVWLLVLMLSSTISSIIIGHYEAAFATIPLLVASIPTLTGTGGNCGTQTSTMVIRGMSLGEIELKDFFKVMFKELRISLIVGVILAAVNFLRICIQYSKDTSVDSVKLGICVSLAIFAAVVMSKLIGCILPMAAKAVKIDPALMAAPFISTIVDASTTLVFFNIALLVFNIKI
ncbi:MAG: magnesium transporter [Ruminococcus sp.]|nr:magnesium transporter [Ruminococcus sp.]